MHITFIIDSVRFNLLFVEGDLLMAKCVNCGNVVPDGRQSCPVCGAVMNTTANQNYSNQTYSRATNQNPNYQTYQGATNQNPNYQTYQGAMNQNPNYQTYQGATNQNQAYQNQFYQNSNNQNQAYQNQAYQNPNYQNQVYTNPNLSGVDSTYMYDPMDIQQNKAMAILSYLWILCLIPMFANHTSRFARFHTVQGFTLFLIELAVSFLNVIGTVLFAFSTLGRIWRLICGLLSLATFVLTILGIANAAQGKAKELPVIGQLHILQLF